MRKWFVILFDNVATTIAILIFLKFLSVFYNIDFLDPLQNFLQDFEVTDIYFSNLKDDKSITPDTNIVLVNIGNLNRSQIAGQLELINSFNPKVIGIDAFFRKPKDAVSDSLLESAMAKVKRLVLVSKVINYDDSIKKFTGIETSLIRFCSHSKLGFANFPIQDYSNDTMSRTTRMIPPKEIIGKDTSFAFSVAIAGLYDKTATEKFLSRNNEIEMINFRRNLNKYKVIDIKDFSKPKPDFSFLKDKIVLMGYLGPDTSVLSSMDTFFTPLNAQYLGKSFPDMYGVVIHANIISMILDGKFIDSLPESAHTPIIILLIYLLMTAFRFLRFKFEELYETLGLFVLLGMMFGYFFAAYYGVKWFHYYLGLNQIVFIIIVAEIVSESFHGSIKPLTRSGYYWFLKKFKKTAENE